MRWFASRAGWCAALGLAGLVEIASARAETALRLPVPAHYDTVEVATYDGPGKRRVGGGFIEYTRVDEGRIHFHGRSGIEDGEYTVVSALLELGPDGKTLRPMRQESRSFLSDGEPLGVMAIDHRAGTGSCDPHDGTRRSVDLPDHDRVANVVLAQALQPLASAGAGGFSFQLLICRPVVRLVDATARVIRNRTWRGKDFIEIEMGPELGPILGRLLGPWLPKVSLWFESPGARWLGHRVPLFAKGPTVTVLREEIAAQLAPAVAR